MEKDAVVGIFKSILKARQVRIVPNRGWSSLTYKHNNIKRLQAKQEGKIVHVLYFGDFDPSGLRMSSKLEKELQGYGLHFQRVALIKPQIEQFGLEHLQNPDPEVLKKLKKDPNRLAFIAENGDLYQIELDALQKDPERFEELVLNAVDYYFDEVIYEQVLN
jgi:5S rRNA maturation endonuclease (ribonuclease M5)